MKMRELFEFTAGSVPGRHHLGRHPNLQGLNNQDAHGAKIRDDYAILVVSDGCGSGDYSEFGSRFLTNATISVFDEMLATQARTRFEFDTFCGSDEWFHIAYRRIVERIQTVAQASIGHVPIGRRDEFVRSHMLATLIGAVVLPEHTYVVSIGDGLYAINGSIKVIEPDENNVPPYIAYTLVDGVSAPAGSYRFTVQAKLPTSSIDTLLLGTDGCVEIEKKADRKLPGKKEVSGGLGWFWSDAAFSNSAKVERRLRLLNREPTTPRGAIGSGIAGIETHRGLLEDDTTLISMRRRREDSDA